MKKLPLIISLLTALLLAASAKATCEGLPISCNYFNNNQTICLSQSGCSWSGACSGESAGCGAFDEGTCNSITGCSWNGEEMMCQGEYTCSSLGSQSVCQLAACTWNNCTGTHSACGGYNDTYCPSQVGCFLSSESSTCNSCNDCVFKLKAGKNVTMTTDIYGTNDYYAPIWTTCISMDVSNTTLDCAGHWIYGSNYTGSVSGIAIYGDTNAANISIKNCSVTGYHVGLLAYRMNRSYSVEDSSFCYPSNDRVCSGTGWTSIFAERWQNNIYNATYRNVHSYGKAATQSGANNLVFENSSMVNDGNVMTFFIGSTPNVYLWFFNTTFNSSGAYFEANNQGTYIPTFRYNTWLNFNGTGYSENCSDSNHDNICDSPYNFSIYNSYLSAYENFSDPNPMKYPQEEYIPNIIIDWNSPENGSVTQNESWIYWNATVSETGGSALLNINNTINYTMSWSGNYSYYNLTNLTNQTTYCGKVYVNDSIGNWNVSSTRCATVNLTSIEPTINFTWNSPSVGYVTQNESWVYWNVTTNQTPNHCWLLVNSSIAPVMTISGNTCYHNMTQLNFTDLVNQTTYCSQVIVNWSGGSNYSTIRCATINLTGYTEPPSPRPIDNLGMFAPVALLLIGAGVLLLLLEALFGSASELLKEPKNFAALIVGVLIIVALMSALL